jgi:hypothetical protein
MSNTEKIKYFNNNYNIKLLLFSFLTGIEPVTFRLTAGCSTD